MATNLFEKLSDAIADGDVVTARELLASHPELLRDELCGDTWLFDAVSYDNTEMVELFVAKGYDINALDDLAKTPLGCAVSRGCLRVAQWLLDHGADVNDGAGVRPTPLIRVVHSDKHSLEIAKLLLERGADLHATYLRYGEPTNALSFAVLMGKEELAQFFREQGATMPEPASSGDGADAEEEIVAYLTKHLGKPDKNALVEIVPVSDELSVAIHVVRPTRKRPRLTLFTTGMSALAMDVPDEAEEYRYTELILHLPPQWPLDEKALEDPNNFWPFEWLRLLAYFPHENETWFEPGQTVSNEEPPKPLAPGTALSCFTFLPTDFEPLSTTDGRRVSFLEVFPLYQEERELVEKKGLAPLLRLLDKHHIGRTVDVTRKNVAESFGRTRRSR
jgi:hypothetical protein